MKNKENSNWVRQLINEPTFKVSYATQEVRCIHG